MKKIIQLATVSFSLLLFISCSNDSDDDTGPINNPPANNNVTYDDTVKAIIDSNCLNCHSSPPVNGAPMDLVTYTTVKEAVQNRNLIGRIENGTMPPSGTLTSTQIQAIKDWQTDGFLQ